MHSVMMLRVLDCIPFNGFFNKFLDYENKRKRKCTNDAEWHEGDAEY